MSETRGWLDSLGLGQYAEAFEANAVELDLIPKLTEDHLKDLGIKALGQRLRIVAAAKFLEAPPATAATTPPPTEETSSSGEAERRHLTVMFCDLVGSTALSEQLDLEEYGEMLGLYQSAVSRAVRRYDGYVARYMGDGLVIYFGYPSAHEDDAERAVRAALATVGSVRELRTDGQDRLQVRIGIASGLVVAGDILGEGASEERAVLGETPNLAARLQSIAKPNQVVVAASTHQLAGSAFDYLDMGTHELKGLSAPQSTWAVVATRETSSRFEVTRRVQLSPFVGRTEELELLSKRWELNDPRQSRGLIG